MRRATVLRFPDPAVESFSYDRRTGEIVIRLHVGDEIPHQLLDVLRGLTGLVDTVRRTQECAERNIRADAIVEQMRRRHVEVARSYQRLRLAGVKHRAAIRALFVDPSFSDLHASTADISHFVKVYALETVRR